MTGIISRVGLVSATAVSAVTVQSGTNLMGGGSGKPVNLVKDANQEEVLRAHEVYFVVLSVLDYEYTDRKLDLLFVVLGLYKP
jgi:hypothetical protein